MSKYRSLQETDQDHNKGTVNMENTHQPRAAKKSSSPKDKNQLSHDRKHLRKWPSEEEKTVVTYPKNKNLEASRFASTLSTKASLNKSHMDSSERDTSLESSVDADRKASEPKSRSKSLVLLLPSGDSCEHAEQHPHTKETHGGDEEMAEAIAGLHLSGTVTGNKDFSQGKTATKSPK